MLREVAESLEEFKQGVDVVLRKMVWCWAEWLDSVITEGFSSLNISVVLCSAMPLIYSLSHKCATDVALNLLWIHRVSIGKQGYSTCPPLV